MKTVSTTVGKTVSAPQVRAAIYLKDSDDRTLWKLALALFAGIHDPYDDWSGAIEEAVQSIALDDYNNALSAPDRVIEVLCVTNGLLQPQITKAQARKLSAATEVELYKVARSTIVNQRGACVKAAIKGGAK